MCCDKISSTVRCEKKLILLYYFNHMGPIPSTHKSYQNIFTVVDNFSKFIWPYATKSTTTREVIACVDKQQQIFGNTVRIVSDRGMAFTSKKFEEYCSGENIEHVIITTGVPRGNRQFERMNRRNGTCIWAKSRKP